MGLFQKVVEKNHFLLLLRQTGQGGGKGGVIQHYGMSAGSEMIFLPGVGLVGGLEWVKPFFDKIFEGDFPTPFRPQYTGCVYGGVANDNLAKGVVCVLDMLFVGFKIGHGISPFLNMVRGGSTLCCRPLITHQQGQAGLSTAGVARSFYR